MTSRKRFTDTSLRREERDCQVVERVEAEDEGVEAREVVSRGGGFGRGGGGRGRGGERW